VAKKDIRRILKELKSQRRQIEQAIAALEGMEREHQNRRVRVVRQRTLQEPAEARNGTTGQVVPFVRGLKLNRS
jgi:hypothetical protein